MLPAWLVSQNRDFIAVLHLNAHGGPVFGGLRRDTGYAVIGGVLRPERDVQVAQSLEQDHHSFVSCVEVQLCAAITPVDADVPNARVAKVGERQGIERSHDHGLSSARPSFASRLA